MPGSGKSRHLMAGAEEQAGIGFEHGLSAIAVMDIKIDCRNFFAAVNLPRALRPDGNIIKQAKPHGLSRFSVVSGRAYGTKCVACAPLKHSIDRRASCANGT